MYIVDHSPPVDEDKPIFSTELSNCLEDVEASIPTLDAEASILTLDAEASTPYGAPVRLSPGLPLVLSSEGVHTNEGGACV